ncbi:TonB-dependent siderophore receptor [Sphingomonas jeddahensis]|uniref:Ferrichrome-iron receptor n=1 Tax=Sphingomonas jeddahensis TaxID=1915074 RepID=A0A1V2EY53_9SPHN|nr:TonB-dependent siderophore receptor [Sphingomonas jeddahensis]ONF97119.1 Ferrichrome-iron receptor precursor [Sphingomonas jeddahensis]
MNVMKTSAGRLIAFGFLSTAVTAPAWSQQTVRTGEADPQEVADRPEDDIIVSGQRQAYVGDFPMRDVPQSIQSIKPATLRDLGITRLENALDLVSGIAHLNDFGGLWESYSVRGFAGDANNVPSGFLVNGFNGGRGFSGPRDTSSVERIDVLKGPTSALFGRGEPGGTVNIITKKPEFKRSGYAQLQVGSFDNYRIEGDFTTPLSDTFAVRINGAYHDAKSYRDEVETKKIFLTPSLLWRPASGTTVSYELEFASQDIVFDRGIPILDGDFDRLPRSRFLGEPSDGPFRIDVLGHQLQLQHDFSDRWSLLLGAGHRTTHIRGTGQYPELVRSRQPLFVDGRTLARQRRYTNHRSENLIGRAELTGRFDVAGLGNTLVVGADYDYFELDQLTSRSRPPIYNPALSLEQINGIDIFNPVYGAFPQPGDRPGLPGAEIVFSRNERDHSWGTYFYDQIDLAPWLKVRVGGRYDEFRQRLFNRQPPNRIIPNPARQHVRRFSPQGGIVVQPTETVSLYGSYGRGFRPNNGANSRGETFSPELSEAYEAGVKYISRDGRITASLAAYTTDKSNILTADPNPANSGLVVAVGSARSRGIEFDLNARLPNGFNVIAAYAYTDAFWTDEFRDPDFALPILPGDPLINVPKHSGNILVTKDFTIGERTAMIGAGVQYIDKRLGETGTAFTLPAATLVKVLAGVDLTDRLRVSGNIDNLFNERWFSSSYAALWTMPGAPRTAMARLHYRF